MRLEGKIIADTRVVRTAICERNDDRMSFHDRLEQCLLGVCAELAVPVPLWLKKNSKELGAFRKTSFEREQFVEEVNFDRFEIRLT